MKKYFLIIILIIFGGVVYWSQRLEPEVIKIDLPPEQNYEEFIIEEEQVEEITGDNEIINEVVKQPVEKTSINLNIPFTPQAPTANWEQPFQDACEEASILMVDYYYQNKNLPNQIEIEELLLAMVELQENNWGGHFNLPVARTAEFVATYFGYQTEIIENLDAQKIRVYLDQGLPVIVPANGKKLANPYFKNGGPDYHMLVIKGYLDDKFITNDPGTKRGADYLYDYQLLAALHDWYDGDVANGPARILIVK